MGRIRAALLLIAPAKLFIAKASPWQGQHTAQPWWFWLCNYLSTFLFFIGMFNRTISVSILGCFFSCIFQVFPRSSPLALNISEAIIYLEQSGELQKLEEQMLSFPKCSTSTSDATGIRSIGPGPFSNLFIITFGTSTIALFVAGFRLLRRRWRGWLPFSQC